MSRSAIGLLAALGLMVAGALILRQAYAPSAITVRWSSGSEEDVAGFNLWRGDPETLMGLISHRVNERPIPAEGSPLTGADYRFVDASVTPGIPYTYQIEEVDPAGVGRRHPDTIEALAAEKTWQRLEGWGAVVVGLALTTLHLRDRRRERMNPRADAAIGETN